MSASTARKTSAESIGAEDWLTPNQASALLRKSRLTVLKRVASGELKGLTIGKYTYISRASVVEAKARDDAAAAAR